MKRPSMLYIAFLAALPFITPATLAVKAQFPQRTPAELQEERARILRSQCESIIFERERILVPTQFDGAVCVETFGQSLRCMTKDEFLLHLTPPAKPRTKAEDPILIPLTAFDEALVAVQLPSNMFPDAIEMTVGTVYEFRTQAQEHRQGKRKGYVFSTFSRQP